MAAGTKRDYFDRVVEELHLDIRDPLTLLLANAMALADQHDALKAELSTHQSALEEAEGRCCPEDFGFEEWIGVLKKRDNVVAHTHLQEIVSLLLQTMVPIGPMRDRTDYPVELQRAIDFLHGRGAQSAVAPLADETIIAAFSAGGGDDVMPTRQPHAPLLTNEQIVWVVRRFIAGSAPQSAMYFSPTAAWRFSLCVECNELVTPASRLCAREDCPQSKP